MARPRTIEISALNISMHNPHSPQHYVDLFLEALRRKKIFVQGEVHGVMLGSLTGTRTAVETNELRGEIYRFVKVDANELWFNTQTNEQASKDDVAELNIPANMRAHMQRIEFVFFPKEHDLWFISQDGSNRLGPKRAERFFQLLLDDAATYNDWPEVNVTVLPEKTALQNMLALHQLSKIVMQFKRPNPDDGASVAGRIMHRMEAQKIRSLKEELIAAKGESIKPDVQTIAEAGVAAINGYVEVHGKNAEGVPVHESTVKKPIRIAMSVDSMIETAAAVLLRARLER